MSRKLFIVTLAALWIALAAFIVVAQEEITITFSSWDTGDGALRNEQIINQFMEENEGVIVETELQDDASDPAILVRMAAGTAPDVIMTGEFNLRRRALASEGGFMDLTPFFEEDDEISTDMFYDEVFNVGVLDDKIYAVNKDFATVAFYVNTDMFEEAGIDIPEEGWTYEDLIDIAMELTLDADGNNALSPDFDSDNIVQYGWWDPNDWVRGWQPVAYAHGAQLLSDDGMEATGYLNAEPVAQALELFRASVLEYHISPSTAAIDAQPGVDFFASGQAAIRGPYGPWMLTGYSENPDINFEIVPMPTGPEGRYSVICWAGFAVNRESEYPDEAFDLVKYFATVGQNTYVEHGLSANIQVSEASGKEDDPLWSQFVEEIPNLHPLDDLKTAHWVECIDTPMVDLLESIHGPEGMDIDIQEALDEMAESADECLAQDF